MSSIDRLPARNGGRSLRRHLYEIWLQRELQLMVIPWMLLIIVFSYIPMYGLIMGFQDYRLGDVIGFSRWAGFDNYVMFFNSPNFWRIMRNTFFISLLKLLFGFPLPIILALLLNEVRITAFKKTVQTVSYLPHFISWVVISGITLDLLSPDGGTINYALMSLGIIQSPIAFMGESRYFWGIVVITDIWKTVGWNAIIYIAAIASVDPELYQAAEMDGAGRMRKMWHITLAGIKPTIVILLILSVGGILSAGFEQILLLTNNLRNAMVFDVSEIIDTYVFRVGLSQMRYSYATAVGSFKALLSVLLLVIANYTARKISEESLF